MKSTSMNTLVVLCLWSALSFLCACRSSEVRSEGTQRGDSGTAKNQPMFFPNEASFAPNPDFVILQCKDNESAWFKLSSGTLGKPVLSKNSLHFGDPMSLSPQAVEISSVVPTTYPYLVGDTPYVTNPYGPSYPHKGTPQHPYLWIDAFPHPITKDVGNVLDATTIGDEQYMLTTDGCYKVFPDGSFETNASLSIVAGFILASGKIAAIDSDLSRFIIYNLKGVAEIAYPLRSLKGITESESYWDVTIGPMRKTAYVISFSGHILSSEGKVYQTGEQTFDWQSKLGGGISVCLVDDRHSFLHIFRDFGQFTTIEYEPAGKINPLR